MADSFDPYHKWLGISPKDQPPHYYRLLALELFESDPDVIESAADQRMAHLRTFQTGQNSALSQQLLNELSTAKLCLLNPQKKADYDRQLRERLERQTAAASAAAGAPVRPLPVGQVPSDATAQRQAPRPVPGGASAAPAAPVVASGGRAAAPSILQRKSRQTPVWKQPAVLGTAGALVLFATAAYFLASSDLITRDTATKQRNEPRTTENTEDSPPPPAVAANSETNAPGTADRTADSPANASARTQSAATRPAGDQPDFEIIEAAWGAGEKWIDVTEGVRGLVRDHRLMMIVWSDLFGKPADPAPGVGKKLRIRYRSRGKEYTAEYFDSWFAYLDGNARLPPTDLPGALELVEARYGAGGTFLDVLPQLQPLVADGRLSVAADEFAATTAAELAKHGIGPNVFKVLWVRYRDHTGDHFDYAWNSQLLNIDTRLPPTAGRPIDLLRQIGLPGDVVYGDWSMKEGTLLAPAQMAARVQIPHRVPTDYALNVVVESDGQIAEVITGLVVGGRQVVVPIDSGGNSSFSGMALLHGLWHGDDKNPTKTWRLARLLEQGRPNTLTYIVHPTSVRVLRDGAQIVHWSGDPAAFSIPDNWKVFDPQKLYLQSYNSAYRITKVELTPLEPEKSPVLSLGDSGLPVDVLKSIDLERDRLHGDWQYDGQALVSPADDVRARLRLPAIVPDSYQLDFVAQRESGSALILTVPIAGTEGTLMIDGYQGKI
ncbi:MAG TPA: hypothetical protein VFW87_16165, partial [Pirellulales bacterium]|nr:hypothetical protein [Pirellulales bacterium]